MTNASPMQYRKPPTHYARPRYEAITLRTAVSIHIGSDRPRWLPVQAHRLYLRLYLAAFLARSALFDKWKRQP